jgi:hypothetical protein
MYASRGDANTVIITDWRLKTDGELDESEPNHAPHVLGFWKFGRWCMGRAWHNVTRIALFDYGEQPSNAEAALRRAKLVAWLHERKPTRVYVVPTPDSTMGAESVALKGTHCWQALRAPDTLEAMRGTRWRLNEETEVVALYPIAKRVKELQRWVMANWLRAHRMPTLELTDGYAEIHPGARMVGFLEAMRGQPLAVDLEFNPSNDIVTAIGLSDGVRAVSIPWDRYLPRNNEEWERGLHEYAEHKSIVTLLRELLAADTIKVAHNFVADIPRLEARMFKVGGKLHDTFAAHAIAFPELRHGLQHAAASLLPCPPWKSLYKPSHLNRGLTRDDAEFWIADPHSLRSYNCRDAFYTHHLARAVLPHVEAAFA